MKSDTEVKAFSLFFWLINKNMRLLRRGTSKHKHCGVTKKHIFTLEKLPFWIVTLVWSIAIKQQCWRVHYVQTCGIWRGHASASTSKKIMHVHGFVLASKINEFCRPLSFLKIWRVAFP